MNGQDRRFDKEMPTGLHLVAAKQETEPGPRTEIVHLREKVYGQKNEIHQQPDLKSRDK